MMKVIPIFMGLCISFCPAVIAGTWYVDHSVSWSRDGKSWATAFKTVQEGVNAAWQGDTVIVAQGKYVENIQLIGQNIILRSTDPLDPAVVSNTIIDGNQVEPVVIFSGIEDEACTLAGFTIQNGLGRYGGKYGGGIYGSLTRATIRNNIIARNRAPST